MLNTFIFIAAAAALPPAPQPEQVAITPEQVRRAGITTVPALTQLPEDSSAKGTDGDAVILPGTVVAPTTAMVVSGTAWGGMVQQVHVATLQTVKAGAPLVTLFSQPWMALQQEYVELAAQARLAQDQLARDEGLYGDGIIARSRLDASRSAAHLAQLAADQRAQALRAGGMAPAALKALPTRHQLSPLLTVRAQAAGTVVTLPLTVGEQADAGSSVATIVRDGPLWAELQASHQQLAAITPGARLTVADDCHLTVTAISPLVNGANQTALVRAEQVTRNNCLKLNAFIEARLAPASTQPGALAVPAAALVRRGAGSYVFVQNAQGFQAVPVQAGAAAGAHVWVRGALKAGAPVATRGLVAIKGAWSGLGEAPPAAPAAATATTKGQP